MRLFRLAPTHARSAACLRNERRDWRAAGFIRARAAARHVQFTARFIIIYYGTQWCPNLKSHTARWSVTRLDLVFSTHRAPESWATLHSLVMCRTFTSPVALMDVFVSRLIGFCTAFDSDATARDHLEANFILCAQPHDPVQYK